MRSSSPEVVAAPRLRVLLHRRGICYRRAIFSFALSLLSLLLLLLLVAVMVSTVMVVMMVD